MGVIRCAFSEDIDKCSALLHNEHDLKHQLDLNNTLQVKQTMLQSSNSSMPQRSNPSFPQNSSPSMPQSSNPSMSQMMNPSNLTHVAQAIWNYAAPNDLDLNCLKRSHTNLQFEPTLACTKRARLITTDRTRLNLHRTNHS